MNKCDIYFCRISNFQKSLKLLLPYPSSKRHKELIRQNRKFHNIHMGQRCFILANGPSIQKENLELLRGENILTVNQMIRNRTFVDLEPMYNFWADPVYFDEHMLDTDIQEFCNLFKETCSCNKRIINFVPYYAHEFIDNHNLSMDRVAYMDTSLHYYDGYDKEFDYSRLMTGFQNIVQYAIAMAIYMGFSDIYICGCDSTGIITKINSKLNKDIDKCYCYDLGQKGQEYMNSLLDHFSIEEQFAGWAHTFHLYEEISRYCKKRNITLINCSKTTIIESLQRKNLEDVINEKSYQKY